MGDEPEPDAGELPHDDELEVEGPNESATGHNPPLADESDEDGS